MIGPMTLRLSALFRERTEREGYQVVELASSG